MKLRTYLVIVSCCLMLSACLSPVKSMPPSTYLIDQTPHDLPKRHQHASTIMVLVPNTMAAYDTRQMAYMLRPHEVAYFSQNDWAEAPGPMLQLLIVKTLQDSHYFKTVVTPPYLGRYDYALN